MNLNEICTAVSYNLPVITIIMNNRVLGNVRQWQTMFYGGRYSQTDRTARQITSSWPMPSAHAASVFPISPSCATRCGKR